MKDPASKSEGTGDSVCSGLEILPHQIGFHIGKIGFHIGKIGLHIVWEIAHTMSLHGLVSEQKVQQIPRP